PQKARPPETRLKPVDGTTSGPSLFVSVFRMSPRFPWPRVPPGGSYRVRCFQLPRPCFPRKTMREPRTVFNVTTTLCLRPCACQDGVIEYGHESSRLHSHI